VELSFKECEKMRGIHACLLLAAFLLITNLADAKVEELSPKDFKNTVLDR
jgi:hypothetical protein